MDGVELSGEYTWEVANFSTLLDPILSPRFEVGTFTWQLRLAPAGLSIGPEGHTSLYLLHPEALWAPTHLTPKARFKLTAVNQTGAADDFYKESVHTWSSEAEDWGFTLFLPLEAALDPDKGYCLNDTLKLKAEITVELRNEQQRQGAHRYCRVVVATDQDFEQQVPEAYFDLCDFSKLGADRQLKLLTTTPFSGLQQQLEEAWGVPVAQQRFWLWNKRQNGTVRPSQQLKGPALSKTLLDLRHHRRMVRRHPDDPASDVLMELHLYLETGTPQAPLQETCSGREMCLYFKYYDWQDQTLRYVGHIHVHKHSTASDIFPLLRRMAGLPDEAPLLCFEEVKFDPEVLVPALEPSQVLGAPGVAQLGHGDIVCFQMQPPPSRAQGTGSAAAAVAAGGVVIQAAAGSGEQQQLASQLQELQQQQWAEGEEAGQEAAGPALTVDAFLRRAEDQIQAATGARLPRRRAAATAAAAAAARSTAALRQPAPGAGAADSDSELELLAQRLMLREAAESVRHGRPEWFNSMDSRDDLHKRVAEQSGVITSLRGQVAQLQQQVSELQAANSQLSTQLQAALALHQPPKPAGQ